MTRYSLSRFGVGGTVVVGGVAEGQIPVLADQEVAAVPARQAPAGDGLPLRVRRRVVGQGEGRVPVLLDGDGLLAGDHRSLVLVGDGDGHGKFPGFALGVPGLHRHQVLVAVGAGPAGDVKVGRFPEGQDAPPVAVSGDVEVILVQTVQMPGEAVPLRVGGPVGVEAGWCPGCSPGNSGWPFR